MQKILISVTNDTIRFSYKEPSKVKLDLNNTNVINNSELVFSKDYIKDNEKIVSAFIRELCQEKNLYRVTIDTNDLALFLLDLFKKNQYITAVCIRENTPLTYALYEKIIDNKNINYIESYSIPGFMIELFDKKGIRSESRTEIFYPSTFMQSNNLTSFSKIFYKMNIRVSSYLTKEDEDDFLAFCNINKYLKTIHLDVFSKNDIEIITNILIKNKIKNIKILIYENIKDIKTIEYLKKLNKKIRKNKLRIELVYSKDYLKNNLFNQLIINTLKICGLIITVLVLSVVSYVGISNYTSLKEVTEIQEKVKQTIEENEEDTPDEILQNNETQEKVIKNTYISSLFSINPDVVGWLKVNNTNVDYPVVQPKELEKDEYYLKHNLYNEKDRNGWIFMDYRNSVYNLDTNTIIYGHTMYYSNVMFGTLAKTYKKDWYTNPENLTISFNTLYETMDFEIFSIYKVPNTIDYLTTYFESDKEFNDFVKLITERSINDFGIEVKPGDKILTLSTCSGENDRLVIHAKLKV